MIVGRRVMVLVSRGAVVIAMARRAMFVVVAAAGAVTMIVVAMAVIVIVIVLVHRAILLEMAKRQAGARAHSGKWAHLPDFGAQRTTRKARQRPMKAPPCFAKASGRPAGAR
jgi:heme exporter protein D